MQVDAIILAGSSKSDILKQYSQVDNEALIPIGSKKMVEYVVDALKGSDLVGRIIIVGPVKELQAIYSGDDDIALEESGDTQIFTLLNGLKILNPRPNQKILIATCDIPLLSTEAVNDFLIQCTGRDGDLFYPIVPKEANEKHYPGVKRTYIHLREGIFTGGNLFLVNSSIINGCARKAEQLVQLRKSPFALSRQIGFLFIIKFLLRLLSLKETEKKFSKLLGIKGKSIISHYPEVGIDVDKPSDLDLVRRVLVSKAG